MTLKETIPQLLGRLLIERPAQRHSITELASQLEATGDILANRIESLRETPIARRQLRHIIGIERWGQRRLQVAQGAAATDDEYDGYQPAQSLDWNSLRDSFRTTREETVRLARDLAERTDDDVQVRHNSLGPLSIQGWLLYLKSHAAREILLVR